MGKAMRLLRAVVSIVSFILAGPVLALGISVGGTSVSVGGGGASVSTGGTSAGVSTGGGGVSASVGSGGTSVGATVGGGGGTIASLGGGSGGTTGQIGITDASGNPIDISQTGGATTATVNLGGALDSFLTDPARSGQLGTIDLNTALNGIGPRNSPAERVRGAFRSLSLLNRRRVRLTCSQVLENPGKFDRNTRILCSLIARI